MMNRRHVLLGTGAVAALGAGGYWAGRWPDYQAATETVWGAKPAYADDELKYLVHHATLAANNHNTQPWIFARSADGVSISPDLKRITPVVDPDNHHLFTSLGCAAENLVLAANATGKSAEALFDPAASQARIAIGSAGTPLPLFDAIAKRQCTRSEYDGRPVPVGDLALLENAAKENGCKLLLITDKNRMTQILDLIVAANTAEIANPAFVRELKSWIRFNPASAVDRGDGLFSGCSGNPSTPAFVGNIMFDWFFTADAENQKIVKQVGSSSGLAVFASEKNDAAHWFAAGRSVQRFALQSTALGMKHAYLNQPVEVPEFRAELAALLGLGDWTPDLVVRFGYGQPMPRSLRRPVAEVIVA